MAGITSPPPGWSWNRVIYALRERGETVASVARRAGLSPDGAQAVGSQRWPRMERAIAAALGMTAQEIWPSRYDDDGVPVRKIRGRPDPDPASGQPRRRRQAGRQPG